MSMIMRLYVEKTDNGIELKTTSVTLNNEINYIFKILNSKYDISRKKFNRKFFKILKNNLDGFKVSNTEICFGEVHNKFISCFSDILSKFKNKYASQQLS